MALDSTVKVKFLGDAANLAREAVRASRATEQVGKSAQTAHSRLLAMAKGFAIGASVTAAAVGVEKAIRSSVNAYKDAAAAASTLSRLTGLAAEDASRLGFAAHETGVDMDSFTRALGILSKNLNNADKAQTVLTKTHHLAIEQVPRLVKGHLEYVSQLKNVTDVSKHTVAGTQSLGFALRDASGHLLPMAELLPKIADRFKTMADGPEKTALALKLFGRNGAALLPFLNKGADGLAKFSEEADKLGITMSGKDVAAYRQYIAAQRSFKAAIDGVKISLGRELFPVFAAWTKAIADNGPLLAGYARDLGDKIAPAAQNAATQIEKFFKQMHDGTGAGGQFKQTLSDIGEAAKLLAKLLHVTLVAVQDFEYGVLVASRGVLDVVGVVAKISDKLFGTHFSDTINGAITKIRQLEAGIEASRSGATIPIHVVITTTHVTDPAVHAPGFIGPTIAEGLHSDGPQHGPISGPYTPAQTGAAAQARTRAADAASAAAATAAAAKSASDKVAAANKAALDKDLATSAAAQKAADVKSAAADALQKATDKLRDALQNRLDTAKGIRDSLVSSNSIIREGVSFTAKDLLARFQVTVAKVKRFQTAISALVHKGFSQEIVQQAAQAGIGSLGAVEGLARANAAQVRAINSAQTAIERAAGGTGDRVASQIVVKIDNKLLIGNKELQLLATEVRRQNVSGSRNGSLLAS